MGSRTITNPVTGERVTFIETSQQSSGVRTVADLEVSGRGGVPVHSHDNHEERIEVLEGTIVVTVDGVARQLGAGEHVLIPRGTMHAWRNASAERPLRFRGTMLPGHPGFEVSLDVLFGLARDGEVRPGGLPKRLGDAALIAAWNQGKLAGPIGLLRPLLAWLAYRARTRGRAAELLRRYRPDDETS